MRSRRHLTIGILAAALHSTLAWGAVAQDGKEAARQQGEAPKLEQHVSPPAQPTNAPFMKPLGRLATILGSVSFLRELCGDESAGAWRDRMNDLVRVQETNPADREILIASYNSGYRSFASVYRRCTPAARTAVSRYQDEGAALSRDIASRFGN